MPFAPAERRIAAILVAAFAFLPLATDLYLASLPAMRGALGATTAEVQLTLTVFIIAFAVSQLAYGPLSDRFGRRPVLLTGATLFGLASLGAYFASTLSTLVVMRGLQAVGACSGQVIGRAIVRDVWGPRDAARAMGLITGFVVLVPIAAPWFGGRLELWFGWRGAFAVQAIVCALFVLTALRQLPETHHARAAQLSIASLAADYRSVVRSRAFWAHTLPVACAYAGTFAWISAAPFILIEGLGLAPDQFGIAFGAPVVGYIASTFTLAHLAGRYGLDRMLRWSSAVGVAGAALMVGFAWLPWLHVAAVLLPLAIVMVANGVTQPGGMAGAISPFPRIAGTASALLGCTQMASGALVATIMGRFQDGTARALGIALLTVTIAGFAGYRILNRTPAT